MLLVLTHCLIFAIFWCNFSPSLSRWESVSEDQKESYKKEYESDLAAWKEEVAAIEAKLEKSGKLEEFRAARQV